MRSLRRTAAVAAAVTMVGVAITAAPASASDGDGAALDAVADVAPNQELVVEVGADLVVEGELATVELPDEAAEPLVLTRDEDGARLEVGLPQEAAVDAATTVAGEAVVYGAQEADGADVVVQPLEDGSVQIQTVIGSSAAPHEFTYDLALPEGATLVLEETGGVTAIGADGGFVAGFATPWAVDADGVAVPTHYVIDRASVVQVVSPVEGTVYPVVADPWLGIALIDDVTRTYYSGQGYRYSVYPSWWGRVGAGAAACWAAWSEAKSHYTAMSKPNLEDQFYCHFDGRLVTFAKGSWNLEAWRADVSYAATVAAGCNP